MNVKTINHNGRKVIVTDFRDCKSPEEQMKVMDESGTEVSKMPDGGVLSLALYHGQRVSQEVMGHGEKWTKKNDGKFKKSAIVGITSFQTIFLNGLNMISKKSQLKAFKTEQEALEYLTRD